MAKKSPNRPHPAAARPARRPRRRRSARPWDPHGINIVEFTKSYNEKTADKAGQIIPAQITVFEDRSFSFILKTPPAADLLRKAAGLEKGGATAKRETVGKVTRDQLREIAAIKMSDLNANDVEAAARQIEGTARSMGIEVVG